MNRVQNREGYAPRSWVRSLSFAAALVVGCGSQVDLGNSVSSPGPVNNEQERAAQTTNLANVTTSEFSSLVVGGEFLYFGTSRFSTRRLWRCKKSDCWNTLVTIANGTDAFEDFVPRLGLSGGRLGWMGGMCDAPDCTNRVSFSFRIWDERFGYWFNGDDSAIYRCDLANCLAGTGDHQVYRGSLVASRAEPTDFRLAESQLYWLDLVEGVMRAHVDGATPAERLSLGSVTEWTSSRARLQLDGGADVKVIDLEVDGAYVYAALNVGTQSAKATLGCETCTPGIAIARWQHSTPGVAREWVLMNDVDLTGLSHLRVFGGEVVWGTDSGNLFGCLANDCPKSKRQIGVQEVTSKVAPILPVDLSRADRLPPEGQYVAIDEQAIYWLSARCNPQRAECSTTGAGDWTLKRTPRIVR